MDIETGIRREIAAIGDLSRSELAERWQAIYRVPPPKGARRVLLERAIGWHLQRKAFGGLKKETLEALLATTPRSGPRARSKGARNPIETAETATEELQGLKSRAHRSLPVPGARLIRDWHGKTHVVDVLRDGYVWQGQNYSSLSVIARQITGARWSGPRFFGL